MKKYIRTERYTDNGKSVYMDAGGEFIFTPYIHKNGKVIYPKNSKVFKIYLSDL